MLKGTKSLRWRRRDRKKRQECHDKFIREMGHFNLSVTHMGFVCLSRHEPKDEAESFTLAYSRGLKRIENKMATFGAHAFVDVPSRY